MNKNLKRLIEGYFSSVFSDISEKYNIPEYELESIFDSLFAKEPVTEKKKAGNTCVYVFERTGKNNKKGDVCGTKIKGEGEHCSKHKAKHKESAPEVGADKECVYVFERTGKNNKVGDVCGTKIKGEGEHCSKHKAKQKSNDSDKKKSKLPKLRNTPSKKDDKQIEEVIEDIKPKIILRKHKTLGVFYHAETRFIFESPIDRKITGKLNDSDVVESIADRDSKLIEKYKFIVV